MSNIRTVLDLIQLGSGYLEQQGCGNPRLDAEVLLCDVLDMDRVQLYVNFERPLEEEELDKYRRLIGLRGRRVPVSYLIGKKEFYSKDYKITRDVLIPRPETEILVELAVKLVQPFVTPKVIDLGTGSGIIGISLALLLPDASILAVDISEKALLVAEENAINLGVTEQVAFLQSDLFKTVPQDKYALICSNPPYIPTRELDELEPEVQQEPRLALDGGVDGLDFYHKIVAQAPQYLIPGGNLVMEIGWEQGLSVTAIGEANGFINCEVFQDYAGKDRVVKMEWPR